MLSMHWPNWAAFGLHLLTLLAGGSASWTAWRAARLWRIASDLPIEDIAPSQVSWDDNPALGVLEAHAALAAVRKAYESSARLNAAAARTTALSAGLTGIATLLGVL